VSTDTLITIYGVVAVTFMMTMYALERRHPAFILAFAGGLPGLRGLRVPVRRMAVRRGRGDLVGHRRAALSGREAGTL